MLVSIIVAMAKNRVIGREGKLPWHLPSDLQRFKHLTMGHTLLMGSRTFESIGQPLPGRRTIVLSRDPDYRAGGCEVATSIAAALQLAKLEEELFICGGADIYRQTLPFAERIYLTELEKEITGDTCFPELPVDEFRIMQTQQVKDELNYCFSILQRDRCNLPVSQMESADEI